MSRAIQHKTASPNDDALKPFTVSGPPDDYISKLLKLIPVDIITVYTAAFNGVKTIEFENEKQVQWIVLGFFLVLTPFYLKWTSKQNPLPGKQIFFCTLSFLLWALSAVGFMSVYIDPKTAELITLVVLPVYTLFIPVFFPEPAPPVS